MSCDTVSTIWRDSVKDVRGLKGEYVSPQSHIEKISSPRNAKSHIAYLVGETELYK